MRHLSANDARELVITTLGLDPERYECTATEVLAALLRRTASFQCPCSPRALLRSVEDSLRGLVTDEEVGERLESTLEELISYGDLMELAPASGPQSMVYTAPPSFVTLPSGRILLLGVTPESVEWLPAVLSKVVTCRGYVRSLPPEAIPTGASLLRDAGYFEVSYKLWLQAPKFVTPAALYAKYVDLLRTNTTVADPAGMTILDSAAPVKYYKGRWKAPAGTGCFVARRPQRYGAPLWSFVKLSEGRLVALVDLPVEVTTWRACDEAWRLQAAIDARNGIPHQVVITNRPETWQAELRFTSPLPRWVQRQLDAIGEPSTVTGALLGYSVPLTELSFITSFFAEHLWMSVVPTTGVRTP